MFTSGTLNPWLCQQLFVPRSEFQTHQNMLCFRRIVCDPLQGQLFRKVSSEGSIIDYWNQKLMRNLVRSLYEMNVIDTMQSSIQRPSNLSENLTRMRNKNGFIISFRKTLSIEYSKHFFRSVIINAMLFFQLF